MLEAEDEGTFLINYPSDDAFQGGVREILSELGGSGRAAVAATEIELHERYPNLRLVLQEHEPQEPLGATAAARATLVVPRNLRESPGQEPDGREWCARTGTRWSP